MRVLAVLTIMLAMRMTCTLVGHDTSCGAAPPCNFLVAQYTKGEGNVPLRSIVP